MVSLLALPMIGLILDEVGRAASRPIVWPLLWSFIRGVGRGEPGDEWTEKPLHLCIGGTGGARRGLAHAGRAAWDRPTGCAEHRPQWPTLRPVVAAVRGALGVRSVRRSLSFLARERLREKARERARLIARGRPVKSASSGASCRRHGSPGCPGAGPGRRAAWVARDVGPRGGMGVEHPGHAAHVADPGHAADRRAPSSVRCPSGSTSRRLQMPSCSRGSRSSRRTWPG